MRDRFVLAYHGEAKNSYLEELDLVYKNFLLLDKHDQAVVVEGDLDHLENFLASHNLKSWVVIQAGASSPRLWSQTFPKTKVASCSECQTKFQPLWFDEGRGSCYKCNPLNYTYVSAYPDAKAGDSPEVDLKKSNEADRCANCGTETEWITTQFGVGVPTCSKACTDTMWKEYINS